jgi:hypothetical protein
MTEEQIKSMAERFLQWKLPEDFSPDCGISFKREFNEHTAHPMKHEPTGTNLLTAAQAEAMIRFITDEFNPAVSIQKIADDIKALKLHPAASEEYDAGYQAARHDAWLIAQEAADAKSKDDDE